MNLINKPDDLDEFLNKVSEIIKDKCSIIAVDEDSNKIIGVVIMKIMSDNDFSWFDTKIKKIKFLIKKIVWFRPFWKFLEKRSKSVEKIYDFEYEFIKYSKIKEFYNFEKSLHLFAVAIDRNMKSKLFKETLIMEAYKIGRSLGVPLITFIASSRNDQERIRRIGWEVNFFFQCIFFLNVLI